MPKRFTDGYFALGLTVGLFSAIIFGLFISSGYQPDTQLSYAVDQSSSHTNQCGNGNEPVWGPWFGLCFGLYDSVAQWMMMVFTIVAAGLLYGTLIQANKTNSAAIKASNAALDANQIMRQEQRPWVTLKWKVPCEFDLREPDRFRIKWSYDVENRGLSPAFNVRINYGVHRHDWKYIGAGRQAVPIQTQKAIQSNSISRKVLFPRENTENIGHSEWSMNGRINGEESGTNFLCVCVAYDLDPLGKEVGYETRVLVIERKEGMFGPFAHTIRDVTQYQDIK